MKKAAAITLPLFGNGTSPLAAPPRRPRMSPLDLALHVYWWAGLEAHALGAAAVTAVLPSERRALGALQQLDLTRKETARRLLEGVWEIGRAHV